LSQDNQVVRGRVNTVDGAFGAVVNCHGLCCGNCAVPVAGT
jgi:hypothetical protein